MLPPQSLTRDTSDPATNQNTHDYAMILERAGRPALSPLRALRPDANDRLLTPTRVLYDIGGPTFALGR